MKASLLALGLYRSSGGPSKSVAAFQRALAAEVVSWVDPREFSREPQIWEAVGVTPKVVRGFDLPVLRQLGYPRSGGIAAAERTVAESSMVSCHSFWRWHNPWLQKVAARNGAPYWFVPHGALDPYVFEKDSLLKNAFLAMGGKRFLNDAKLVVCATTREYEKLASLMPKVPPAILPWPLEDHDFRERDEETRMQVRRRLGIPDDAIAYLWFGRLHPMKRPLETIAAFAAGAPADAHLLVVGNEAGVTIEACKAAACAQGVQDRVHVTGAAYGADRTAYFDAADVYVSLSRRENFNFTAAEALASGLPVILSAGNDLGPELAAAGCSWQVPSEDDEVAILSTVGSAPSNIIAEMGCRGRAWAEAHLRYEVFATRLRGFAAAISR